MVAMEKSNVDFSKKIIDLFSELFEIDENK